MLRGHQMLRITTASFSPDGRTFVTADEAISFNPDGLMGGTVQTARVWDVATGKEIVTFRGHEESDHICGLQPGRPDRRHRL